ncbi:MAG: 50S ribosomal protein L4 [Lentisphaeria bacterium]|nr:50S ribosomal protein L4 [Lentisphaeria bacterium]
MTLNILSVDGAQSGTVELNPAWVEREKGEQAVHDSVVAFRGKLRAGTASTKNRAKIRGSGAKPYRQKGTGRARMGSLKSPILRGGGVAFGPTPRSFAKHMNKKVERLALRRAFTARLDEEAVILVDEFKVDAPKTKKAVEALQKLGVGEDVLVLVDNVTSELELATGNLPSVEVLAAASVNTYLMLLFGRIVITKAALDILGNRIAAGEKAE